MNESKKLKEREELKKYLYENPKGTLFITHNDADGLACIVADVIFRTGISRDFGLISRKNDSIMKTVYKIVGVNKVGDTIYEFLLLNHCLPKTLIITDLSFQKECDDELLTALDSLNREGKLIIELYDHHKTATWLNDYEWANVTENPEYSAASYYALCKYKSIGVDFENDVSVTPEQRDLWAFLQKIARYDTWKWKESPDYATDEYPTLLIPILGYWNWIDYIINGILMGSNDKLDVFIEKICENQVWSRLDRASASLENVKEISGFCPVKTYLILGNHQINTLHEVVANHIPDDEPYVFCVLYPDTKTLSMRTKSDIDCSEIAQRIADNGKGGGHPKAAGCTISNDLALKLIKKYYESSTSILDIDNFTSEE